jgi:hypothetical protein
VTKVVLLLSDKRSGSTMFQEALCRHPDISHVDCTPHTYYETHHWLKGAVLLGMAPPLFSGGHTYPGYGSKANARAYLVDCVTKNVPEFVVPDDDRELVFKGWEALCKKYCKPVFFEKSPQYLANWASLSLLLEWIDYTELDVKVIGLTRNPLSVQYSAQKRFHTDPNSRQFGWLKIQKNLLAFAALLPKASYLHVKYEEIIENPVEEFEKVCEFIDVPINKELGATIHGQSANKWKDDPNFDLRLDGSVKQMARHFGYSAEELDNLVKPGVNPPRRFFRGFNGSVRLLIAKIGDRLVRPIIMRWRQ